MANITGQAVTPSGQVLPGGSIVFERRPVSVAAHGSDTVMPDRVVASIGAGGQISFSLIEGSYAASYGGLAFPFTVTDDEDMQFNEGLGGDVVPPDAIEIPDLIQIAQASNLGVAPHPVALVPDLDALGLFGIATPTGTYDARLHDLAYVWSFGDDYEYTAPQNGIFKQAGSAIGPRGAHVYRAPGTYVARLDVYGFVGGDLVHAFSEREIAVAAPEDVFPANRRVFVSASGDFTHANGAMTFTSLNDAIQEVHEYMPGSDPAIVVVNRGEEYAFSGRRFGFNTPAIRPVHVVAGPGAGANPVINSTGSFNMGSNSGEAFQNYDFAFQNLDFRGALDSTDGDNPEGFPDCFVVSDTGPNSVLIDGCSINGFAIGVHLMELGGVPANGHRSVWVNDAVVTNYGQWGIFGGTYQHFSATGCRVMSDPNATINNGSNGGGTLRLAGTTHATVLDACDIYCTQGWSMAGPVVAAQPCARLDDGMVGQLVQVTRCAMEGGYTVLSISPTDRNALTCNVIVDSNYLLGCYQTTELLGMSYGGATIRNNIMVMPDAERVDGSNGASRFLGLSNEGGGATNLGAPITFIGNTLIDLVGGMSETSGSGFTAVTTANNASSPADAPFVQAPVLWTPREIGYRSLTETLDGTETPSDVVWPATLETGSLAIGSASGDVPVLNMTGDVRELPANRGAL